MPRIHPLFRHMGPSVHGPTKCQFASELSRSTSYESAAREGRHHSLGTVTVLRDDHGDKMRLSRHSGLTFSELEANATRTFSHNRRLTSDELRMQRLVSHDVVCSQP